MPHESNKDNGRAYHTNSTQSTTPSETCWRSWALTTRPCFGDRQQQLDAVLGFNAKSSRTLPANRWASGLKLIVRSAAL
ncbi:hypothetical protein MLPF_2591 [Mycobacterium lepromatosis]|nr:hypothetical protein MLPF_2591 [Mycobacterium lepromatosis]